MSEAVPTSRVYVHGRCGESTVVGGSDFAVLSNPFAVSTGTMCMACRKGYPLKEFTWADTGETIAARRKRLRAAAPLSHKLVGWLFGPLLCALVGGVIGWLVKPNFTAAFTGAGVGFFIFTAFLLPLVMKWLFQIDYRALQ